MKKEYKGQIVLDGKAYNVEVRAEDGECFVEGQPMDDCLKTLSEDALCDLARTGWKIAKGDKPQSIQAEVDAAHNKRWPEIIE